MELFGLPLTILVRTSVRYLSGSTVAQCFGAAIRAREQCIFAIERDGADRSFDGIVIDLDAAVAYEAGQAFPA